MTRGRKGWFIKGGGCHQFEWPIEIKLFANIVKSDLYFEVI